MNQPSVEDESRTKVETSSKPADRSYAFSDIHPGNQEKILDLLGEFPKYHGYEPLWVTFSSNPVTHIALELAVHRSSIALPHLQSFDGVTLRVVTRFLAMKITNSID